MAFIPGKSGNPAGRPKGSWSLTGEMKKYLGEKDPETGERRARLFIESMIERASEGNTEAIKQVMARIEGPMPTESKVDVTSAGQAIKQWIVTPPEPDAE